MLNLPGNSTSMQEILYDYYPSDVFDKAVGEILGNEFAQQLRQFLNHPEDEAAVLTVEVICRHWSNQQTRRWSMVLL